MNLLNKSATPNVFKFTAKLFEFSLINASKFFAGKNSDPNIDDKMKTGFANFLECLNLYLQQSDITSTDEDKVTIQSDLHIVTSYIVTPLYKHPFL